MSSEMYEIFTFTWRVKNFSMCPVKMGSFIESPALRIRQFGKLEWSLKLYPRGYLKEGKVACYLACKNLSACKTAKVEFKLSVVTETSDEEVRLTENDFKKREDWGYNEWISLEKIKEKKNEYLPNDNLTIRCSIKCIDPCDSRNTEVEIIKALSRNFMYGKNLSKCCCETTVRVQTKRFLWPIPRFLSLYKNERITLPVYSSVKETPSFNVTLCKNYESICSIEIRRKDEKSNSKTTFVRCAVSAVNTTPKYGDCRLEDEYLFKSEADVWTFSSFLDLSVLEKKGYFEMNEGVLFLQFDFAFSVRDQLHHIEKQDWAPTFPPTKGLAPLELFTATTPNDEPTVVTLRTEHRTFTVHRALLKSEVFDAMFENDMEEETGVVDMSYVDPETLERMLSFLYCGTVGDISQKDVKCLYVAARRYEVESLLDYCSSVLMSSLTESNVCDILRFASFYGDERLLQTAKDFVVTYCDPDRILTCQDWKDLMDNNLPFAASVMYKMLTK